jgi:hypothetical protein
MQPKLLLSKSSLLFLPLLLCIQDLKAQCTSSAAHNATAAASVSFTGSRFGFAVPNNSLQADNVYATATAILSVLSGPTQNLTLTNFGFNIPTAATICGVVVTAKKKALNVNVLSNVADNSVKLVKGGIVSGTNKALAGNWTTTNTSFTYGGDTDSWGLTLTPADVNASNFGIAFSAYITGTISLIPSAQIDNIQVTVYYTIPVLPVVLSEFKASVNQNKVLVQWKSESEIRFSHYEIERSTDGIHFKKIASVNASPFSKEYAYTDAFPNAMNFYRLRMVDEDGSSEYSRVVTARLAGLAGEIRVDPNPAPDASILHFANCKKGKFRVEIISSGGQVLYSKVVMVEKDLAVPLSLVRYAKGLYVINVYAEEEGLVHSVKLVRS